MFVACGIWCLADVSSVSPSSEQTQTPLLLIWTCIPYMQFLCVDRIQLENFLNKLVCLVHMC